MGLFYIAVWICRLMEIEKFHRREETGIDTSPLDHRFIASFLNFRRELFPNLTAIPRINSPEIPSKQTDGNSILN